ncbi:MAG: Rid family detoxifying hydrolase [Pseudomonadota bacterium]
MKMNPLLLGAVSAFVFCSASAKEPSVQFLNSGKVVATNLPFSEAVRVDNTLYLSGQLGVVPGTRNLVAGGIKEQTTQVMTNIRTTLEAHGYTLRDLVKCTVMLSDIANWGDFNEVYKTFFDGRFPARSALGANGLALGGLVEVECIAVLGAGKN